MSDLEKKKAELKEEIDTLKHEFKIDLPKRIAKARSYGDLKENAEYDAARERQAFVKARITQLSDQLSKLNDINLSNMPEDKIAFGSKVTVYDIDSEDRINFEFVSSNEVNPSEGKISLSSPFGVALNLKQVGDTVEVTIPAGKRKYFVEKLVTIGGNEFEQEYTE